MPNEELEKLRTDVARKQHLERSLAALKGQIREAEANAAAYRELSSSEDADVAKLEGVSLRGLYYRVTGQLEHKLDLERIEAYAARMKLDAAEQTLAALRDQSAKAEEELRSLAGCEQRYNDAVTLRLYQIKTAAPADAQRITEMEQQMAAAQRGLVEIRQAKDAANKAHETLRRLQDELNSAEDFATWDVLGGGVMADVGKHGHLDSAQWLANQLQSQLHTLSRELKDVAVSGYIAVEMDSGLRYADYFIDNIWTDWAVMDHINRAQEQAKQTAGKLSRVKSQLSDMQRETEAKLKALRKDIENTAFQTARQ
jgi:ribosome-binding factor A